MVWMPAHLQFENGGESVALDPDALSRLRERPSDGLIVLARKTDVGRDRAGRASRVSASA